MPLLKCVESMLFDVLGNKYLNFLKEIESIDLSLLPRGFITKEPATSKKILTNYVSHMELGSYIFAMSGTSVINDINIVPNIYFKLYMESLGKVHSDQEYIEFIKKLKVIKDDYRNISAHMTLVDKKLADSCFEYLLCETVKFLNYFFNFFYW